MEANNNKAEYRRRLRKRIIIVIIALLIVFGGIFGFDALRYIMVKRFLSTFQFPAPVITTGVVTSTNWQPMITAIGDITAINSVSVTAQQSGLVTKITFDSGKLVHKGELLAELDTSSDQQDLKNYEAQLRLSQINYNQQSALFVKRANAQTDLDNAVAQLKESQAAYDKTLVTIEQKHITAPFDGKIGIRQINLGQYVSPGTSVATLDSMNPIYIQFTLPEQYLKELFVGQTIQFTVDNYPNETFTATITATDSQISTQTRNLQVQATAKNDKMRLFPGMFANVNVLLPQKPKVLVVTQTAVTYTLYGDTIFVITQNGVDKQGKPVYKAQQRYVKTGERRGNQVVILSGVKEGEVVATSGQLKLEDGMTVLINNSVQLPTVPQDVLEQKNE